MTKRFATRLALVAMMTMLATPAICAQQDDSPPPPSKPGKPINTGDVLSGELTALKVRDVKNAGKRIATYQITSEPRRLPAPNRRAKKPPIARARSRRTMASSATTSISPVTVTGMRETHSFSETVYGCMT